MGKVHKPSYSEYILIFTYYLRVCFGSVMLTETLFAFLVLTTCATCHAHLILLNVIVLIMGGEGFELRKKKKFLT
jgi:hypothetical protein